MKCMLVELPSGSFDKAADADTPSGDEWLTLLPGGVRRCGGSPVPFVVYHCR